jgi:predicted lipoprotein with Yx(FWY)xxD motif
MKTRIATVVGIAGVIAAALIPVSLAGPSQANRAIVSVAQSSLGRIIVDGRGRSLYLFEKDLKGTSSCNGACVAAWPPLTSSSKPRAGGGVRAGLLGWIKRKDGRWQVTYKGHPLYTFVKDTQRGQTNGEGVDAFGAEWYVVSPAGAKVQTDRAANTSSDPASGGYGSYGGYGG